MASSSSANYSYDVFLSFRGTDTRFNITSHLHRALCDNNVKVFIDDNIDRREEITSFLMGIIEGAKISIIAFSSNYASSTFCLDELVKIMECNESKAQVVFPIFYKVDPSPSTYLEAFARHETVKQEMNVERWKLAFHKALNLAGWHITNNRNEATVIGEITKQVLERLNCYSKGEMRSKRIVGRTAEDKLKTILQCLMFAPRVGIYGMGGVGKTTIVTRINNKLLEDASFFHHIYWVTVSKDSSVSKLQSDIAKLINLDLSGETNERKIAAKLFNKLNRINKFVLILDDVWEAFETEDVGIPPLVDGRKLLLTTRKRRVCEIMECRPIEVKPLLEGEAWDLFIKESRYQKSDSPEWKGIVESVVKECAGLPLAIVVLARSLRGMLKINEWRKILRELKKPCESQNPEMEKVFKPLKISYDRLPNDKLRQCFLYYSLFPEDYEMKRRDLIDYLIGMGLGDELDSRQDELDEVNAIIDELIGSSLLECKLDDSVKMHDVIRDMAFIINLKVGLRFQDPLKDAKWSFNIECVEVMKFTNLKSSLPNPIPNCSKLRTLLVRDHVGRELTSSFFANMQSLTILHMKRFLDQNCVSNLPDCISNLGNLKVLILSGYKSVKRIPYLGGLENLRHLKISGTGIEEIPKGIERLFNLRVLNLSRNKKLSASFPNGVLEKLSHLQSLELEGSQVEVKAVAVISLEKLEILRVHFDVLQELDYYIKSRHWRRLLEYHIYGFIREHYAFMYLMPKLSKKAMYVDGIVLVQLLKEESVLLELVFIPDDIQRLDFGRCDSLLIDFNFLRNRAFADLQTIHFYFYEGRYTFTLALAVQLLHNVKELFIAYCSGLEEIIITEEEECVDQSNYNNYPTIELPNLKTLKLESVYNLRSIYKGRMMCPSLEYIEISGCDKLERLPFCMEEQNYPRIKLRGYGRFDHVSTSWWDSLKWDNPNAKSMYQLQDSDA